MSRKSMLRALPFYKSSHIPYKTPKIKHRRRKRACDVINKQLLEELPFFQSSIDYGIREIRPLDSAELLQELPFHRSLNKKLIKHSFKGFARSYAIEKLYDDPMKQLHASKPTIKELLIKMHGFKYIITLLVTLKKDYKVKNDDSTTEEKTEHTMLYFNSYTKRVINENFRHDLDLSFEEVINKIQNWINDGFGWAIDLVNGEYVHVSKYDPLHASSYLELPKKYAHPRKGLINIKNKINKCLL